MESVKVESQEKMGEFSFIRRFFAPLAGKTAWNLGDDAAALPPLSSESCFVVSVDNLAEGVHFFPEDSPRRVAQKLLRRNLSDMVAMGAVPRGYFLSLAFNPENLDVEEWFEAFQQGLASDQEKYALSLLGGDTTRIKGGIFLSITIVGEVHQKGILRRNGAQIGDELWVTGTIGNSALGLLCREGKISDSDNIFAESYLLPNPPVKFLVGDIASAGIDISDGLLQDLEHIAEQSQVGISVDILDIPLLPQAQPYFETHPDIILEGGDDYQLLFTINPKNKARMMARAEAENIQVTCIGEVIQGKGLFLKNTEGKNLSGKGGWRHF
ncbi:thiamine-phosphate kinase [Acetobacteraceae bacterium]|nr:thiamine-phosphate kinase [Acetobacteraceae bacterium]